MDTARPSILLVDDDVLTLDLMAAILKNTPYILVQASGGAEAIVQLATATAAHLSYTVVVTDIQMPDVDGFAVLHAARRQRQPPTVIVATGMRDLAITQLGEDVFGCLLKPYLPADFRALVSRAVAHHTTMQ